MRIAIVCQSYPPMVSGAAFVAKMLAGGLTARGHNVLVLAASEKKEAYSTQDGRLQIARLRSVPNPLRANQRSLLWPKREIAYHLARFKPDVIHLHEPLALGWLTLPYAQEHSIPVALTLHQLPRFVATYLPPLPGLRRLVKAALWQYGRWFLRQCSAVITPTNLTADEVKAHTGLRPIVIGNGANLDNFNPTPKSPGESTRLGEKYGLDPMLPILLHVGRLDADKQVERAVRAAAMVMAREPCQLLVIGDGHQRSKLISLSQKLGITKHSHFPGFVTAEGDLPGLYRAASLFVTASEIETFGIVILEAMASGLPVVAPRATCLPELINYGRNGYLTYPGDEVGMADCMTVLLRDRDMALRMGSLGRQKALRFTTGRMIERHQKMYGHLTTTSREIVPPPDVVNLSLDIEEA